MNRTVTSARERLRGKQPFNGHYEVLGSVELEGDEAALAERQIAEADAEHPAAQVSFAWMLRTLRDGAHARH